MSTLSHLTAEISAVVPVFGGVVRGGRLIVVGFAAIVVAVVAVVAVLAVMGLAAVTAVEPVRFVPVGFVHEKGAARPPLGAVAMAIPSAGGRTW